MLWRRRRRQPAPETAPGAPWAAERSETERYYAHGRWVLYVTLTEAALWEVVDRDHIRLIDILVWAGRYDGA